MSNDAKSVSPADLIGDLPPVTAAVVGSTPTVSVQEAESSSSSQPGPASAETPEPERDAKGVPFDSIRHLPKKHPRTGCWLPRRQSANGAPKPTPSGAADAANRSFVGPDAPEPAAPMPAPAADQFEAAGAAATAALIALGCTAFGEEWTPRRGEAETLQGAFAAYFKAKGVADIPPGLALTIAVLGYAGPRFTQPKTLTRLQQFKLWFANLRARRAANSLAAHMPHVPTAGGQA